MSKRQPPADKSHDKTISHGTLYAYDKIGCRCGECTEVYRSDRVMKRRARAARATPQSVPHGLNGYAGWMCRCEICCAAHNAYTEANRSRIYANLQRRHAHAIEGAVNHGKVWTGAEMEVASRPDLTDSDVAEMLGRSIWAVINVRQRMRSEPKYQRVLGTQN